MDEVVQVPGVYQVIAENVTLKKTVDKCLAWTTLSFHSFYLYI
jgi:hypothetical protein